MCFLRVLYLTCAFAKTLPGVAAPACTTEPVMVTAVSLNADPIEQALFETEPERRPTACVGPAPLTLVPIKDHYPECLVGMVTSPDDTPHKGACCGPGCTCAGTCEWLPWGIPPGYELERLRRLP